MSHCSMPLLVHPSLRREEGGKSGNSTYCSVSRLSRRKASPRARRSRFILARFLVLTQQITAH